MTYLRNTTTVHHRPALRSATVRLLVGLSLFAATGAGAGTAGPAHAATPGEAAQAVSR